MKLRGIVLFVMCAVLVALPVFAAITPPPSAVVLDNCTLSRFSPSFAANNTGDPLACSADIWAYCRVYDTTGGQIVDVQVTLNTSLGQIAYPTALWSGSETDGTWAISILNSATYGNTIRLAAVQATSSSAVSCSGSNNVNTAQCVVNYSSYRSISSGCSCSITASLPVCGTNNVAVVHHTASAGCSGNQSYDTYGVCDYCDPQFVATYTSCQTNRLSSTPFVGNATKSYTSQNPSCCATTSLTSDCNAPADSGAEVQCKLDYWTSQGKNTESNSNNQEVGQIAANTTTFISGVAGEALINDQLARPLVFDFNGDGTSDILVQNPAGFGVYTVDMQTVQASITSGFDDWQGQAGFYGFNNIQDANYVWDIDLSGSSDDGICVEDGFYAAHNITNPCMFSAQQESQTACENVVHCAWDSGNVSSPVVGGGFAAVAYNATNNHDYYVQYVYNGTWQKRFQFDIFAVYGEGATGSGVACYLTKCYFVTNNNRVVQVDTHTGIRQHVYLSGSAVNGGAMQATPAIVVQSGGASTLVTKGIRLSTLLPAMFSCRVDGNNFLNNGSLQLCSVLDVVSTAIQNVSDPIAITAADSKPEVYWSELQNSANTSTAHITYARLGTSGNWNTTRYGVNTIISQGGTPLCFSNPAGATCADGGKGVYIATKWTSAVTSANFIAPTTPYAFDTSTSAPAPLAQVTSGTSPTNGMLGAETCFGGDCYMLSLATALLPTVGGAGASYQSNYIAYHAASIGGSWSAITAFPSTMLPSGSCNFFAPVQVYRSQIVAVGNLNGNLVVLTAIPPLTNASCGTNIWTNKMWKYTAATSTWSLLQDFGTTYNIQKGIASCCGGGGGSAYYGRMNCNTELCYASTATLNAGAFSNGAGKVFIARSNSAEVFSLLGTLSGGATANTSATYSYAETPTARYIGTTATTGTVRENLVRYAFSAPSSPGLIDTASTSDYFFLGLYGYGTDTLKYAAVPQWEGSTSTSCTSNASVNVSVASQLQFGHVPSGAGSLSITPYDFRPTSFTSAVYADCLYYLKIAPNGGAGSAYDSISVRRFARTSVVGAIDIVWSIGGLDQAGRYYAGFNDIEYEATSTGVHYNTVMLSENLGGSQGEIFHPLLASTTNVSQEPFNTGAAALTLCDATTSSSVGAGCRPVSLFMASQSGSGSTGNMYSYYTAWDSGDAHAGLLFDFTSEPKTYYASLAGTGSTSSTSTGVYTEYGCYRPTSNTVLAKVGSFVRGDQTCVGSLATIDTDSDGKSEVVAPAGIFKSSGAVVRNFTGTNANAAVEAVDLSSDGYVDFMKVTAANIYVILSNPMQSVSVANNLSVATLACSYDAASHSVTTTLTGVSAANPGFLVFGGNVQANSGTPAYSASFTEDTNLVKTIVLPMTAGPGSYKITETAHDLVSGELVSAFCNVATTGTGQSVNAAAATCNLGTNNVDGDFNYYTHVDDPANGWLLGVGSGRPVMTGTQAWFQTASGTIDMFHGLDCRDAGLQMDVRVQSAYGNTEQSFLIIGDQGKPIGGITLSGGYINAYSTTSHQVVSLIPGIFYNVSVLFDVNAQAFSVTVDGVLMTTVGFANPSTGAYNTVEVTFNTGSSYVDYVRTFGTTGTVRRITNATDADMNAYAKLDACVRLGDQYLTNGYDVHNRSSTSMHVQAFCDANSWNPCSYDQLAEAVRYNGDCFDEAFQYCVYNTYAVAQGVDAVNAGFKNVPSRNATGLDGAAVCGSVLTASVTANRVAVPLLGGLWSILTTGNNWLYAVIIIFLVILVAAVTRKGS